MAQFENTLNPTQWALRCGLFAALGALVGPTYADADLWGHVLFGQQILANHVIAWTDPYSFTSDVTWVNHEWLAEVVFATAYRLGGGLGLIGVKVGIVAALMLIAHRSLGRDVRSPLLQDILTGFVVLGCVARTGPVRPQLFSLLLFTVLVTTLRAAEREGSIRRLYLLPPVFALWANLHGAWIVGLFTIGLWSLLSPRCRRRDGVAIALACAVATLLNPYSYGLWTFLVTTVGTSRPEIADWMPLVALPWPVVLFECVPIALGLGAVLKTRRVDAAHAAMLLCLAMATLRISRVDAFLHAATMLLLAPQLGEWLSSATAFSSAPIERRRRSLSLGVFAVVALMSSGGQIVVEGSWRPDAGAVDVLKASARSRKLLTWFDWGEYAIWHLSGVGTRVSMDGRRETVYSESTVSDHFSFYRGEPSGIAYGDRLNPDVIWLPSSLPIVPILKARGWRVDYESPASVVLSRGSALVTNGYVGSDSSKRTFP